MADDAVIFEAQVKGISNLKDLKTALKDAKSELLQFEAGTDGFARAQAKVSVLSEKMKDLGDSVRIQGSGVERLSQSFGLLREAFEGGSIEKAKIAFTALGQAMSAVPIFLLIEGVKYLIENFNEVTKAIGEFFSSEDKSKVSVKELSNEIENQTAQNKLLTAELNGQIAMMEAQGASIDKIIAAKRRLSEIEIQDVERQIELQKVKLEDIKQTNQQSEATQGFINLLLFQFGLRDTAINREISQAAERKAVEDEVTNKIIENEAKILEIKNKFKLEEFNLNKKDSDEKKKKADESEAAERAQDEREFKAKEKLNKEIRALKEAEEAAAEAEEAAAEAAERAQDEREFKAKEKLNKEIRADREAEEAATAATEKKLNDERVANAKKSEQAILDAKRQGVLAAQTLVAAYFAYQLSRAHGNAAEELKIRKQAFEVDKAFNIARAIQDGIRSVQAALTIPPPGGEILAGVNAGLAAANVAKIAATEFNPGSSVATNLGTANTSVPNVSGSSNNIPQPQTIVRTNTGQLLDDFGNPITQAEHDANVVKAYVVTHEIERKLNDSRRVKEQARF